MLGHTHNWMSPYKWIFSDFPVRDSLYSLILRFSLGWWECCFARWTYPHNLYNQFIFLSNRSKKGAVLAWSRWMKVRTQRAGGQKGENQLLQCLGWLGLAWKWWMKVISQVKLAKREKVSVCSFRPRVMCSLQNHYSVLLLCGFRLFFAESQLEKSHCLSSQPVLHCSVHHCFLACKALVWRLHL